MSPSSNFNTPKRVPASANPYPDRILEQYVSGSAALWNRRRSLIRAAGIRFRWLQTEDDRLAAHLQGLRLGGVHATNALLKAFSSLGFGEVFPPAVLAIEREDLTALRDIGEIVRNVAELEPALISALGWSEPESLRGTVQELFRLDGFWQRIALAACGKHRVNPAAWFPIATRSDDPRVRAAAFRIAGEVGASEWMHTLITGFSSEDATSRFWAASSAALLGGFGKALEILMSFAATPGNFRERALQLVLRAADLRQAHEFLTSFAHDPEDVPVAIQGAGIVGDPQYVPWLINHMEDDQLTRAAGESFSLITGVDFIYCSLERPAPESPEGADESHHDEDAVGNAADGLPWPDTGKIRKWWDANRHDFQPGVRYFMGERLNRENCLKVLKKGYQRQRIAAAHYLSLLKVGTPLFNTSAPAWRQQRLLAKMT